MHARLVTAYTRTTRTTRPVATMPKASVGPYFHPSSKPMASPRINWTINAFWGERWRAFNFANDFGNAPARPKAKAVRVNTLVPAMALAKVELMMAKSTRAQKTIDTELARPSHGTPFADAANPVNLLGP